MTFSVKLAEPTFSETPWAFVPVVSRPLSLSHFAATSPGSFLSLATWPIRSRSPSVVIFAEIPLRISSTAGVVLRLLTIGTMFCAAKLLFGSSRATNPLASMAGSVVNRSTAST